MSKQQIAWCIYVAVFVLPCALYFIINGYWWLFDGNHPIVSKMFASSMVAAFMAAVAWMWADDGEVWK